MTEKDVKCSECEVSAQVILEGNTPERVVCPQCGASESYAEFKESTGQQMTGYAAGRLSKTFKKLARNNKNITYKPGNIRPHNPKFRVDLTE